ncbi:GNAT family N-acetyltransferase [Promicromonospora sukumoe]|uniref:GNAT family N-acetyltransferase n=1 Tax=Promicromonospora sukumoe TaxID=88382 RepID=UPI00037E514A|nr:GNAT family protein [Promicromonospora sukumoe]
MTIGDRSALSAVQPTFGLRVRWEDLELRLPDDSELLALASLAASGVHNLDVVPFSWPWTRGTSEEVSRNVLAHQWRNRGRADADDWVLSLALFRGGAIIGEQQISAKHFPVTRSGLTGSWLGLRYHGQGIGTRMRLMALHLAFEGFGAMELISDAYEDNPASNAVSRRLGYTVSGTRFAAREGRSVLETRYRMTREQWNSRGDGLRAEITLEGLPPVRQLLGMTRPD